MDDSMTISINDALRNAKELLDCMRELHAKNKALEIKAENKRRRSEYWRTIAQAQRREIKQLKEKINDTNKSRSDRTP